MKNGSQILANREIRHNTVRVVTETGSTVLHIGTAIRQAEDQDMDLVLINDQAVPPICKILELDKYKYELQRKEKETARAQRESRVTIKEVQFKPNIDQHDFETKCNMITKFISKGNKVKVMIQFRGRERQHTSLGYDILSRVLDVVEDIEYDGSPSLTGNRIIAILKGTRNVTTDT